MKPANCCSLKLRSGSVGPSAAHRNPGVQHSIPSTGRGGTASTSGRGHLAFSPGRADQIIRHVVQKEASHLQQGALDFSDLFQEPTAEAELPPRKQFNRRIKRCSTPAELANLVMKEVSNFDNQNTSHALARLAKMFMARTRGLALSNVTELRQVQADLRPAIDALTRRMHQLIGTYETWDTTLSLWAYAQLGHHDETALKVLCDAALEVVPILKPVDCANTVVAFAYLDHMHTQLLRQIVTTMLDNLDDFSPGEVAQVMWGLGKLGCHPGEAFLVEIVDTVHRRMPQYSTQELVLVLWSFVRLGFKPGMRFLRDSETTLLQRLPHLTTCDVCVSVWSLARLRYKAVRLLDEIPQAVGPRLWTCSNAELCALISGFATAHHYHRVLLDAVAGVALSRLNTLSHQEVCVLLWTYGTFHHRPVQTEFGKQLAAALLVRMRHFTPQGIAMTVKALAQLQWRSEAVLSELVAAAEQKLQAFKPLEMSQLLYGLSALQCKDLNIFFAVVRRCIAILKNPLHPHYGHMVHHRVVNSVIMSCQLMGYVPWTLIDFAESKGIRVKQPDILSSRDEEDEGMLQGPQGQREWVRRRQEPPEGDGGMASALAAGGDLLDGSEDMDPAAVELQGSADGPGPEEERQGAGSADGDDGRAGSRRRGLQAPPVTAAAAAATVAEEEADDGDMEALLDGEVLEEEVGALMASELVTGLAARYGGLSASPRVFLQDGPQRPQQSPPPLPPPQQQPLQVLGPTGEQPAAPPACRNPHPQQLFQQQGEQPWRRASAAPHQLVRLHERDGGQGPSWHQPGHDAAPGAGAVGAAAYVGGRGALPSSEPDVVIPAMEGPQGGDAGWEGQGAAVAITGAEPEHLQADGEGGQGQAAVKGSDQSARVLTPRPRLRRTAHGSSSASLHSRPRPADGTGPGLGRSGGGSLAAAAPEADVVLVAPPAPVLSGSHAGSHAGDSSVNGNRVRVGGPSAAGSSAVAAGGLGSVGGDPGAGRAAQDTQESAAAVAAALDTGATAAAAEPIPPPVRLVALKRRPPSAAGGGGPQPPAPATRRAR